MCVFAEIKIYYSGDSSVMGFYLFDLERYEYCTSAEMRMGGVKSRIQVETKHSGCKSI